MPETARTRWTRRAPVFKPLGGMSAPTTLLTYGGPVSELDHVTFKQPIGRDGRAAHRRLREDADLHALDDATRSRQRHSSNKKGPPKAGPFCLPADCAER